MRRLLERHRIGMASFDFTVFDREPQVARDALSEFFLKSAKSIREEIAHCERRLDIIRSVLPK